MAGRQTLCHVINGDKILLKMAVRGISKGRWNAPGGNIEDGETAEQCAIREVYEETGLKIKDLFEHGTMNFHLDGKEDLSFMVQLFSTEKFDGEIRSSDEGEVRWFERARIPLKEMWDDDNYWMHLMLNKKKFDADFYLDEGNKRVGRYSVVIRN